MRILCSHCNKIVDIIFNLRKPIKTFATYKLNQWNGVCPVCGKTMTIQTPPAPIAVVISDDRPEHCHFEGMFDGRGVADYLYFNTVNSFMHWWTDCMKSNRIPGMWYHVMFGKKQVCCGTMDPDDIESFRVAFPLTLLDTEMRAVLGYTCHDGMTLDDVIINGVPHIVHLSEEQVEQVYRHQERVYRIEDAQQQLTDYIRCELCIVGTDTTDETLNVLCAERYGKTLTNMCCPADKDYLLEKLADLFLSRMDADTIENELWNEIIHESLHSENPANKPVEC